MNTTTTPQVRFRTVDGVRVRYADSGGSHQPTILLTSPWPESLYAFAPIWDSLSSHARLFAVDLPGFGASEGREDLLAPRAMGEFLAELIAAADLGTPHVVAPDVGTAAALFAAAAHPDERKFRRFTAPPAAEFYQKPRGRPRPSPDLTPDRSPGRRDWQIPKPPPAPRTSAPHRLRRNERGRRGEPLPARTHDDGMRPPTTIISAQRVLGGRAVFSAVGARAERVGLANAAVIAS